jgi:hypothetical protein
MVRKFGIWDCGTLGTNELVGFTVHYCLYACIAHPRLMHRKVLDVSQAVDTMHALL